MKAKIVLGLQFGDEGKGITTDYLCHSKCFPQSTAVVRFSGGQQAGHTVKKDDFLHVFATFGSGTLRGCSTYISEHCTFYPPNMVNEYNVLRNICNPVLYLHPKAMCTTPYDIAFNRAIEELQKHGSCGIGVGTTMKRNLESPYKFYATDLMYPPLMRRKLFTISGYYSHIAYERGFLLRYTDLAKEELENFDKAISQPFVRSLVQSKIVDYEYLRDFSYIVFEGSQGILLDQEHGLFPHVTYAHTTSKNAIEICKLLNINPLDIYVYYVTRCYQTRHGNGWMSNEDKIELVNNETETNVFNKWQGNFRVGEIDYSLIDYALACDSYSIGCRKSLVVTCLDQRPGFEFDFSKLKRGNKWWEILESFSPDSKFFKSKIIGYR